MLGVITPVGVTLRKNRRCGLHIGVIFTKLFYDFLLLYLQILVGRWKEIGAFFHQTLL
jgi:hypothetical protein